ncbi:MAG TPA: endonuclease/exonuclease/phosphatase family protein [Bacteroidales bacterium]|nr:endonuclease/exonuclease/phosphatase family protein [Bacteroidales bacterium]
MRQQSKNSKQKWHIGLIAKANALFALFLLISYLAVYIPPYPFWPLGLFGLAYPVLFLINGLFLLFWVIVNKKYFLISLISILIGWNHFGNHFRVFPAKAKQAESKISLTTYNIRLSQNTGLGKEPQPFAEWLKTNTSGILCFQESYYPAKGNKQSLQVMGPGYNTSAYHRKAGLAILSHYPAASNGLLSSEGRVFCLFANLITNNDTIRIYNTQLASNYLDDEKTIFDKDAEIEQKELSRKASILVRKLINGYQRRVKEVRILKKHIAQSPYPVVLCGDFNNTPMSYTYHQLKSNRFADSFRMQQSVGIGNTYIGKMPPIRIDYVLHDKNFETLSYKRIKENFSDHYPLKVILSLPNKQ